MFMFFKKIRRLREFVLYVLEDQVKWNEVEMNQFKDAIYSTEASSEWVYRVRKFDEAKIRYAESLRIYELIKKNI